MIITGLIHLEDVLGLSVYEPKSSFKRCEAKLAKPKGEIDPEL